MSTIAPIPGEFIARGTLPENLPPVFSSAGIWSHFAKFGSNFEINNKAKGEYALFNASKRGGQRRLFQLPHPAFIREQALFFQKYWSEIGKVFEGSPGSASKPRFHTEGPRYVQITPHAELPRLRLSTFSRFRYSVVTDVSRFFPSIYTHSIPWALHGKEAAKAESEWKSAAVFGNRLDFILRQGQSKQTVGIPVGPDTSKVVSELILSAVDADFITRSGKKTPTYVRHVDDYWVAGNTYEECEKHLHNLRASLRAFELDINESKTRIVSTKFLLGEDWPFEAHRDLILTLGEGQLPHARLLTIFRRLFDLATATNDDGVIKHTIRLIDENQLWSTDWAFLQDILAQCSVQFPHTFDYVARVIAWRSRTNGDVDTRLWRDLAIETIQQHATVGRDSEVVWAMWLLKELGQKMPKSATDRILENSNSLTLGLLAHFAANRLTSDNTIKAKLRDSVTGSAISGSYWPLTLELTHLKNADPSWLSEDTPPIIKELHKRFASIINWDAKPKVFDQPTPTGSSPKGEPESAIEDFSPDYGGEIYNLSDNQDSESDLSMSAGVKSAPWL